MWGRFSWKERPVTRSPVSLIKRVRGGRRGELSLDVQRRAQTNGEAWKKEGQDILNGHTARGFDTSKYV